MNSELRNCPVPWCESDVLEVVRSPWTRGYGVVCQNCRAQGPDQATEAEAIAAWNRRALDATPPEIAYAVERPDGRPGAEVLAGDLAPETPDERQAAIVGALRARKSTIMLGIYQMPFDEQVADWIESGEWRRK